MQAPQPIGCDPDFELLPMVFRAEVRRAARPTDTTRAILVHDDNWKQYGPFQFGAEHEAPFFVTRGDGEDMQTLIVDSSGDMWVAPAPSQEMVRILTAHYPNYAHHVHLDT